MNSGKLARHLHELVNVTNLILICPEIAQDRNRYQFLKMFRFHYDEWERDRSVHILLNAFGRWRNLALCRWTWGGGEAILKRK